MNWVTSLAAPLKCSTLIQIPLEVEIRSSSDEGSPIVVSAPSSESAKAYNEIAERVVLRLVDSAREKGQGPIISL